jgi:UDP-N-acetylmuramoyl-L-alanyl-D-glutamate--2,6-diaminopimelate ligase
MEPIDVGQPFMVVVDYAHTPDALSRALDALRPSTAGRLSVVFGCGGDRDGGKRPLMGEVAARKADRLYVTSDNPRNEAPQVIIDAILSGIRGAGRLPDCVDPDREAAIRLALTEARAGDLVLIAGKGHENYQEDSLGRHPFDDREVARRVMLSLEGNR